MWNFIDAVSGEEDYDNVKDLADSMVGECRDVNEKIYETGKLVLFSDSEIDQ